MQAALARWLATGDGAKCAYAIGEFMHAGWPEIEPATWERARREATDFASVVAAATMIWCDPPMVDMWAAAADTYPDEVLEPHHLPDPDGIVILAKPLPRVIHSEVPGDHKEQISAITWSTGIDGSSVVLLTWHRHRGLDRIGWGDQPRRTVVAPGLSPSSLGVRQMGRRNEGEQTVRLLQALTGLIRSPLTDENAAVGSKAARKEAARAGITEPRIRRVYLRRPEHAADELAAARDARAGRPTRGHWVSGHWKRQWHPSIGEHRWIRVGGYPRGGFTAGEVVGPTARIARGDRKSR
ncbi:hypothetical protein GCM10023170_087110 [Phytohabitans houttuyneae]